jgi:hypothetical protein
MTSDTWRARPALLRVLRRVPWWLAAAAALWWAAGRGPVFVLETAVLLAVIAGLVVSLRAPQGGGPAPPVPHDPDPQVATAVGEILDALDGIEHRRVELGSPWPAVVVGPTGVQLLDVCPFGEGRGRAAGPPSVDGSQRYERNARITAALERALSADGGARSVPVRSVAVVAAGTETPPALDGRVEVVPVDRLAGALARGPVLPMADVDRAFRALAVLTAPAGAPRR